MVCKRHDPSRGDYTSFPPKKQDAPLWLRLCLKIFLFPRARHERRLQPDSCKYQLRWPGKPESTDMSSGYIVRIEGTPAPQAQASSQCASARAARRVPS